MSPVKPDDLGTIKLGEYTGLDITATKAAEITDTEVDDYIAMNVLPNYPMEVSDEVKEGDTATINFVGSIVSGWIQQFEIPDHLTMIFGGIGLLAAAALIVLISKDRDLYCKEREEQEVIS